MQIDKSFEYFRKRIERRATQCFRYGGDVLWYQNHKDMLAKKGTILFCDFTRLDLFHAIFFLLYYHAISLTLSLYLFSFFLFPLLFSLYPFRLFSTFFILAFLFSLFSFFISFSSPMSEVPWPASVRVRARPRPPRLAHSHP